MHAFRDEMDFALEIVRQAGAIALRHFRTGLAFDNKADESPVTAADRECESFLTAELSRRFPDDGLLGEEGSSRESRSGRRWIIDPIDGTRDFVRGSPAWANLLALEASGTVVLGLANLPAMGDLYVAALGAGSSVNGEPIRASGISRVREAVLCVDGFNRVGQFPFGSRLVDWMAPFWAVRSMGGSPDALMVARGQADLWIETSGKPWDYAPLKIIAEEAGARFFNFDGSSSIYTSSCVICAPGLEDEARRFVMQ